MIIDPIVSPVEETQNQSTEPTQTPEVVAPENAEQEQQQTEQDDKGGNDPAKSLKRLQRRIDRRTAELHQTRGRLQEVETQLAQVQKPREEAAQQQVDPYELAREIASTERFNEKCNGVVREGEKKFKDFGAVLQVVATEAGPLFDGKGKPTPLLEEVMEAESPAALLHHLGTNPDLAAELADLSPRQLARQLDRIERAMREAPKPPARSNAPAALQGAKGSAIGSMPDPSNTKAYIKWANEQERAVR